MNMTTRRTDGFDRRGDASSDAEGEVLQHNGKTGVFSLDGQPIEVGEDGLKIAMIMDTGVVGEIYFEDRTVTGRRLGRLIDGFDAAPFPLDEGWSPSTSVLAVGADEEHFGRLYTFRSASWGGRRAFDKLINPWRRKNRSAFPIVTLESQEKRGDVHHNFAPVFKIVGWSARGHFRELIGEPVEDQAALAAPAKPAPEPIDELAGRAAKPAPIVTSGPQFRESGRRLSEDPDDSIPF
ncbi:MAG TPA: hypothetical protein VIF88_03910 [Methylocystis sp.]